eukprot:jgi/Galph1/3711/GphlegSOOS_G2344.1
MVFLGLESHTQLSARRQYIRTKQCSCRPKRHTDIFSAATVSQEQVDIVVDEKKINKEYQEKGENLRKVLRKNKVDVYTLGGKLRNCGGAGQCGTCIVDVVEGLYNNTSPRTRREEILLQNKPESWRLSCCTNVLGPLNIRTKPQERFEK